ncbi:glycosyltransferase family 2 protein [Christensenellaceae bacterium OttesenSCG-928-K19]|nr:glycosyltransferase family 2 protein [Christensenellaceae bacterium OttesenSCG-928-K19]
MKLIIQIPCYNEENTLSYVVQDLPKQIAGIDIIETLIIDDGSTDRTVDVARELGIDHVVKFPNNKGLAYGFMAGIDACLRLGADIIVNTDGDNQYYGGDIPCLVQPIIEKTAEIVIGDRDTDNIAHFSSLKKRLQKTGSTIVRKASGSNVTDTTSGFRAYSRDAAMKLNVLSEYTYTLETIIDAGNKKLGIANVKIKTNKKLRESRLFKSMWGYIKRSAGTIIRTYISRRSLKVFLTVGTIVLIVGLIPAIRFLYFFFQGDSGHIQSLILSSILIVTAVMIYVFGFLADMVTANRKVIDEILYRIKKLEYDAARNKNPRESDE